MQDRLLLLVENWFAIEAEGGGAILAACFMTTYLGLLSTWALVASTRRGTETHQNQPNMTAAHNTYDIDQAK